MDIKKIYFDLDSVLADFEKGVADLCGLPPNPGQEANPEKDNEMWMAIKNVDHFYDRLELMPGALKMFNLVYDKYGDKCEILSAPPKPKRGIVTAEDDKRSWVKRLLSEDIVVNLVPKEEKKNFVTGKDCILIDDREKNIEEWTESGGTGILHKNAEETMDILKNMGVL